MTAGRTDETRAARLPLGLTPPRAQAVALIALGVVCALLSLTIHPLAGSGLLALGVGLLLAHLVYRPRLFIPGVTATAFALAYLLNAARLVSNSELYGAYILAAALSVGLSVLAARRSYVGHDALSPALLLALIGALVVGTALPGTGAFYGVFVSLTMPAIALAALGVIYFFAPER
jgi:hypothetical protein